MAAMGQKNIKRLLAYMFYKPHGLRFGWGGYWYGIRGYSSTIIYITIYIIMNMGTFACLYLMKTDGKIF